MRRAWATLCCLPILGLGLAHQAPATVILDPEPAENEAPDGAETVARKKQIWEYAVAADRRAGRADWKGAARQMLQAIALSPQNRALLEKTTSLLSLAGAYEAAQGYWERHKGVLPQGEIPPAGAGLNLLRLGRAAEAEEVAAAILARRTTDPAARLSLAAARFIQHDDAGGAEALKDMPLPEVEMLCRWLGEETASWEKALGVPAYTRLGLAILGAQSRDSEPAPTTIELRRTLQETARLLHEANAALRRQDGHTAYKLLDPVKSVGPSMSYLDLARAHARFLTGDVKGARSLMEQDLTANPGDDRLAYAYALLLIDAGDYGEARHLLNGLSGTARASLDVQLALADTYAGLDRVDDAWRIIEEIAKRDARGLVQRLAGDAPHLKAIRAHPGFSELVTAAGFP